MRPAPSAPRDQVLDVRRADERAATQTSWLDSRHSFAFGPHYDPANTHFGLLLVSNEDVVRAGTGFDTHPHRDMEIVTWVLEGSLVHQDSTGHAGVVHPGLAQRMSAGSGILHSERNDSWPSTDAAPPAEPVHFVQMWVVPDESGRRPGYEQREVDDELLPGRLVPVASGRPGHDAAIRLGPRDAALHAARLLPGNSVDLPAAPYVHLHIARGAVDLEGAGRLTAGDAVRLTSSDGPRITAVDASELLVWEMHRSLAA